MSLVTLDACKKLCEQKVCEATDGTTKVCGYIGDSYQEAGNKCELEKIACDNGLRMFNSNIYIWVPFIQLIIFILIPALRQLSTCK